MEGMSTVEEIERAIQTLNPEQVEELYLWLDRRLDEYRPQLIDLQIEADLDAGLLDERIQRAVADFEAGNTTPLRRP
jgi:hypothetical protein